MYVFKHTDLKLLIEYESKYGITQAPSIQNVNLLVNVRKNKQTNVKNTIHSDVQRLASLAIEETALNLVNQKSTVRKPSLAKRPSVERDIDSIEHVKFSCRQSVAEPLRDIDNAVPQRTNKDNKSAQTTQSGRTMKETLIRNTPTDLYHKYQQDWIKYKHTMPGENSREEVREVVRKKMHSEPDRKRKVIKLIIKYPIIEALSTRSMRFATNVTINCQIFIPGVLLLHQRPENNQTNLNLF